MRQLVALGLGMALTASSTFGAGSSDWTVLDDGSRVRVHADPYDGRLITLHQNAGTTTMSVDDEGDGVAEVVAVTETTDPDGLLYEYLGLLNEQESGFRPTIRDLIGKLTFKELLGSAGHGGKGLPKNIRDKFKIPGIGPAGHGKGWDGNTPYTLEQTDDNRWSKGFDNGDQHDHIHLPGGSQEDHVFFEDSEPVEGKPWENGAPPEPEENPGDGDEDGNGPRKIGLGPYGGAPDLDSLIAAMKLAEARERFLREHTTLWAKQNAPINPQDRGGRGGERHDPAGTSDPDGDDDGDGGNAEPNMMMLSLDPWINPGWTIEFVGRR